MRTELHAVHKLFPPHTRVICWILTACTAFMACHPDQHPTEREVVVWTNRFEVARAINDCVVDSMEQSKLLERAFDDYWGAVSEAQPTQQYLTQRENFRTELAACDSQYFYIRIGLSRERSAVMDRKDAIWICTRMTLVHVATIVSP